MYKPRVKWSMLAEKAKVGDRMLPDRYEVVFEPDADEPGPAARLVFEVIGGVPQCREVHVVSTEHGREVRRTDLARIALEDHLEVATLTVAQPAEGHHEGGEFVITVDPAGLDMFRRTVQSARRTVNRRGPGEAELRDAADVYESADRAPTQAVADKFGIAHRTASLWIARARRAGYL